jgi:oligopeptidase B
MLRPPSAKRVPHQLTAPHGHTRTDPYYWLNERENPAVVAYLEAENAYTEATMAHTKGLQDLLFEEMKGRILEKDQSVPYLLDGYYYYTRYEPGSEYAIHCRRKGSKYAPEQVMLDVNQLAQGHAYFQVGGLQVSEANDLLAYAVDAVGRRIYSIHFKNLTTGELLPDHIPDVTGNVAWSGNNQTLFYTKQDPETLRAHQVWRHRLGTPVDQDVLVYEETDETFAVGVGRTKSRKYLEIMSHSTVSSEVRFLDAYQPEGEWQLFYPRKRDHEYAVDHVGDLFYIRTNMAAKNFRLMAVPPAKTTVLRAWREVIGHRKGVFLESFEVFKDFLVLEEREAGLTKLRVIGLADQSDHYIEFDEPTYTASLGYNPEFDTQSLRFGYTSLTTPNTTYEYHLATRRNRILKRQEVLGGFARSDYQSERVFATARDGVQVPISLVYRRGTARDGAAPLLLYAYGAYGLSLDPYFSSNRLSLLDRGFVFALAHVRGGQEMGRHWYESGKLLHKKTTFFDYIDCATHLVSEKYAHPQKVFAQGGSAGGLLMGAVANLRPDLFRAIVADVPFVDVVTTMLDDSIPLTTGEYDEWGDPRDPQAYRYMLSYSPYDKVTKQDYPAMLVTAGFHDSQVQYWEPAKWVAKLRTLKTNLRWLLLKTNLEAGHSGASGRYAPLREIALEYAFMLSQLED